MTTMVLDLQLSLDAPRGEPAPDVPAAISDARAAAGARAAGEHGARTLDELIVGRWQGLFAHGSTACPVCAGPMHARRTAQGAVAGGRCRDCGSTLS